MPSENSRDKGDSPEVKAWFEGLPPEMAKAMRDMLADPDAAAPVEIDEGSEGDETEGDETEVMNSSERVTEGELDGVIAAFEGGDIPDVTDVQRFGKEDGPSDEQIFAMEADMVLDENGSPTGLLAGDEDTDEEFEDEEDQGNEVEEFEDEGGEDDEDDSAVEMEWHEYSEEGEDDEDLPYLDHFEGEVDVEDWKNFGILDLDDEERGGY